MNHSERDDTHLARTMRALAESEAAVETPSRVEAAVMARWDASRRRLAKADQSRASRFVHGAATAAGITLIGALAWQRVAEKPSVVQTVSPPPPTAVNQSSAGRYQTVAVVGGPLMSGEPVRIVRMRVARSVLSELGIPSSALADTVDIDVLVGEDGVARGVRVPM